MQGKTSASFKDSSLFGVSFSEHAKADFSSSALRCKVCCRKNMTNYAPKKKKKNLQDLDEYFSFLYDDFGEIDCNLNDKAMSEII